GGVKFDPAGSLLVAASCDGRIETIATATGKVARHRPEKEAHIGGGYGGWVAVSDDGKTLYVIDENAGFELLDATTLKRRAAVTDPRNRTCKGNSPKEDATVDGYDDGALIFVDRKARRHTLIKASERKCMGARWLDASRFVTVDDEGEVTLWDVSGGSGSGS